MSKENTYLLSLLARLECSSYCRDYTRDYTIECETREVQCIVTKKLGLYYREIRELNHDQYKRGVVLVTAGLTINVKSLVPL